MPSNPLPTMRRQLLGALVAVSAALPAAAFAQGAAQGYPNRPIQILVGFAAGSTTDIVTRVAAEHLRNKLGQPVVVINKPGANGSIAAIEAARAAPDGYTLMATNSSLITVNPQLYRKPGYAQTDFTGVTTLTMAPLILTINPQSERTAGMRSAADMAAWARSRPGELRYASAGPGNITGLAFEVFANKGGFKALHVPYKGAVPAQQGVMGREVDTFLDTPMAVPHVKAGRLTALAVTGPTRWRDLPDVPTMKEAGFPDVEVVFWGALVAPARTPPEIIDKLHAALASLRDDPNLVKQLLPHGDIGLITPKEFNERIRKETAIWGEIIRRENLQLD
jgi:tripartite-type tricarboxylate transporter receptor subunit TctC